MIPFATLTLLAVLSKLLGTQIYTPLTVLVAGALFVLRYVLQARYREQVETFLLQFGILNYALANRDPSYYELVSLLFCMVPSVAKIGALSRLAKAESTCLLLLAYAMWSCAWSSNLGMTLAGIIMAMICLGFSFGYVVAFKGDLSHSLQPILFILVVLAVSSILVGAMGHGSVGRTFAGVTFHRSQLGLLLGLLILLSLFFVRQRLMWLRLLGLAGGIGLLLYIDSKSAIIAITLTVVLWVIINSKRWYIWSGLAGLAVLVFVISLPSPKMDHFAIRMGRDPTFTSRTDIWSDSLKLFAEQPFTGFGYSAVWSAFENRLSQYPNAPGPKYAHAFNVWIEWGLQLGWGGMILYLMFLGVLLFRAWCCVRTGVSPSAGRQAICLLVYIEIYNLANVSSVPMNRFGFFILAVTTACLYVATQPDTNRLGRRTA